MAFPARKRRTVAIGFMGQSTEHGPISTSQKATYPQAFQSLRKTSVRAPLSPAIGPGGGWLFKVYDDVWDAGWEPRILNGAVGGISFIKEAAGLSQAWAANTSYYRLRPSAGPADRGYAGDLVQSGGGVWRCIAGNDKYALGVGPDLSATPGRGDGMFDSLTTHPGVRAPGIVPTQNITVTGAPTGGTFTLNGNSSTTAAIAYNATAATVQTALRTLGGVFSACTVTGNAGGAWQVVLNPGTTTPSPLTLGTSSLTGGTSPSVVAAPFAFADYKTGPTNPFPADAVLAAYPRGYEITEVPASSGNAGVRWRFEGFVGGTPPNGIGGQSPWPLGGVVLSSGFAGMGFDPLGLLHRLHEEMQRVDADRKIIYIANGQSDLGLASGTPATVCTTYRDALIAMGNFYLDRGYEVMIGFTSYSPGSTGTTVQWDNLVLGRAAAITTLQAGTSGARVYSGANLYALMGTTGPMASSGGFLDTDNIHLNGRGCIGPSLSGVTPAGTHVANAIKAVL